MTQTVALIGAGMMGESVLGGLLSAGHPVEAVLIVEKRAERARELVGTYGVRAVDTPEAARAADVLLLVVKPADVGATLAEVAASITPGTLVVSLAAGVSTAALERRLPDGTPVVRVMPNTPALVGQGMAAISPGRHCGAAQLATVQDLLAGTGAVVQVPESQQDAVTAVSGSGPAYVFLLAEAMTDAAVLLGLPRATAAQLVTQTLQGSAAMLARPGATPAVLREQVTSPGGTTAAALRVLEDNKLRAAFMSALEAARDRSKELSAE